MWLTFAVLTGILVNPARPAFLLSPSGANILTLPQAQAAAVEDKKALNKKLDEAVDAGDAEKTRALLKSGAEAGQALILAVKRDDTAIAGILIEAGAQANEDTLEPAMAEDHEEMVRFLLSHGAKVDSLKYREFLAQYLANHGHLGEAGQLLRAAQKDHPMIPFLEDLEAVGIPEGGEFLRANALALPLMIGLGDAGLGDHMDMRLRTYHYRKSPAEIESFYAGRIPGFRFVPQKEEDEETPDPEGPTLLLHAYQLLQVKPGSVKIMNVPIESLDPTKMKDGIEMQLFDIKNDPDLKGKLGPNEHSCYLILVNFRK